MLKTKSGVKRRSSSGFNGEKILAEYEGPIFNEGFCVLLIHTFRGKQISKRTFLRNEGQLCAFGASFRQPVIHFKHKVQYFTVSN